MRTIVIGDVHGCIDELDELLGIVAPTARDRLVFLGDLVDRGPDPVGVVRRVRELGADCLMGNHEEKHLRWERHEAMRRQTPSYKNPMRPLQDETLRQHNALRAEDLAWMAKLPTILRLDEQWIAVHGGLEPLRPVADQRDRVVLRLRFVMENLKPISTDDPTNIPEGARPWAERWPGPQNVVYGHAVHSLHEPRVDHPAPDVECWGIDTGCCFGGHLSALILPSREVVRVRARRAYAKLLVSDE